MMRLAAVAVLIGLPSTALAQECWVNVGQKGMYGSYDQGVERRDGAY